MVPLVSCRTYRKNSNNRTMWQSEISSSGKGAENTPKICPPPLPETEEKRKKHQTILRETTNVLEHGPIIRVLTVVTCVEEGGLCGIIAFRVIWGNI